MEWINSPESSNIARYGYDRDAQILGVEFTTGATYHYFDVPEPVFDAMKAAPSKGQFLAHDVKGNYRYARV